jgi:hypothetical protein
MTEDFKKICQQLLDTKVAHLEARLYDIGNNTIEFDRNYTIIGEGYQTIIRYTGTGSAIKNPHSTTASINFCAVQNLMIVAPNSKIVIDWKSIETGRLSNLFVSGNNKSNDSIGINLDSEWPEKTAITGGANNVIETCYIGSCKTGIHIGNGANSTSIRGNRFQNGVKDGYGIDLDGTELGKVSSNRIENNTFEYIDPETLTKICNGIRLHNTDCIFITGNRFESMVVGIDISASNINVFAPYTQNYFSSILPKNRIVNRGCSMVVPTLRASASINGDEGKINGQAFNLTAVREATGKYKFRFLESLPDANYTVFATSSAKITMISGKTAEDFEITCEDALFKSSDASVLDVQVFHTL